MEIVLRETERLNTLMTDFLLFAAPTQEKKESVNICDVIRETLSVFENSPEASGLRIVSSLEGEMFVEGSARQISQVFWNLLLNAALSMPEGGVVRVSAGLKPASGPSRTVKTEGRSGEMKGFAEVNVIDTGVGIEPDAMGRIFDPFFSTRENGTGLGLALAHRIVESHGGRIEVRSAVGEGAAFKVVLPIAAREAA
jgi:two-component system sensor histidine kinase PilS (NtrC family)